MAESFLTNKRKIKRGPQVKTGCATCRIRKIKCDENKPFCQKCVSTGRACDGYDSRFRSITKPLVGKVNAGGTKSEACKNFTLIEITPQDINLLNHYLSTKTMFDVNLGCDDEARQILQASLTDPPIQHAILSLRALREDLEVFGDVSASTVKQTPSYYYGLQQYSMALRGLASNLSVPRSDGVSSALLCCQILISIEQVRKNYSAMAQHIIRGLSIMREYRARPGFSTANKLVPAHHDQLPFLDVFVIKIFSAPCRFKDSFAVSVETFPICPIPPSETCDETRFSRNIAPDMRTELTRIAASTLQFLDEVSQAETTVVALRLLSKKSSLMRSLKSWLTHLEEFSESQSTRPEPVSVSFIRLFHSVLTLVLLGTLDVSSNFHVELRNESDRLQDVGDLVTERLRNYIMCNGSNSSQAKHSTVH